MTQTKHTPAPWEVLISKSDQVIVVSGRSQIFDCGYLRNYFCSPQQVKADAYLAAAAPELLESAKIASSLINLIEKWADAEQSDSYEIMDEIVSIAQGERKPHNAILKAQGKS